MALENLGGALEAPEARGGIRETAKLPERIETPRETGCLPEHIKVTEGPVKLPKPSMETRDARAVLESTDVRDTVWEKVNDTLRSPEGIKNLMEKHPEKVELWQSEQKALGTMNDPMATDAERRSAQAKLSALKGQLLETAVKDALADVGLTVEVKQRVVEGQDGGTRPDVIAKNDTDHPVHVFGLEVKSEETLSIECKCGRKDYLDQQLRNHIPNQLSGQIGHKALLTTADIRQVDPSLVKNICQKYDAALIVLDAKVSAVENSIKGVPVS